MTLVEKILAHTRPSAEWDRNNRELVEQAERYSPGEDLSRLGFELLASGNWTASFRNLDRVNEEAPDVAERIMTPTNLAAMTVFLEELHTVMGRATALAREKDHLGAYNLLVPELRSAPYHAGVLSSLGFFQTAREHFGDAELLLERAEQSDPYLPEVHNNLGVLLLYTLKPHEAFSSFRRALELRPNYPEAMESLRMVRDILER